MGKSHIDSVLEEIAKEYQPGTLVWMKRSYPDDWSRMVNLETEINQAALEGDVELLEKALERYRGLILTMVGIFKIPKGETGDLFGKGRTIG